MWKQVVLKKRRKWIRTGILIGMILILVLLGLMIGNTYYSLEEVVHALVFQDQFTIINLRLPRVLLGVVCGFSFGIAGHTFQNLFRNPLASPDIIGVTSGAGCAAVFGILILRLNGQMVSVLAVLGGLCTSFLIYIFARHTGALLTKMILIGLGMQALLNAITSYLLLRAAPYDLSSAMRWLSGSLNNASMESVYSMVPVVLMGTILLVLMQRSLQILKLGDAWAISLGISVSITQMILFLTALVLVAFTTAASGPIASIAFLAGPIAQKLYKNEQDLMIPSGLVGVFIVLLGDLVAQNFLPARYPVGVITGLLGAPYLLYLLIQMNRKGV